MKKYLSLVITILILTAGIITGCSKSGEKNLVDCLNLTKSANSMEAKVTTSTQINGKTLEMKMDMQVEDLQKDMKSKVNMEMMGQTQEFYLSSSNGSLKMYAKDMSGKFSATSINSSEVNGIDSMKSFDAYVEVIGKNPDILKKVSNNTYELNVPKEKAEEIYTKVSGQKMPQGLDSFKVEFVIGDDGYIKNMNVEASSGSINTKVTTEYSNYNKKFDIVMPEVSK